MFASKPAKEANHSVTAIPSSSSSSSSASSSSLSSDDSDEDTRNLGHVKPSTLSGSSSGSEDFSLQPDCHDSYFLEPPEADSDAELCQDDAKLVPLTPDDDKSNDDAVESENVLFPEIGFQQDEDDRQLENGHNGKSLEEIFDRDWDEDES